MAHTAHFIATSLNAVVAAEALVNNLLASAFIDKKKRFTVLSRLFVFCVCRRQVVADSDLAAVPGAIF